MNFLIILFLSTFGSATASNCSFTSFTCPSDSNSYAKCAGSFILRCIDGCPVPGNCADNLAGVPPIGVKWSAGCYEDSPTAGNAQCVADCVEVTALNGSSFYPMGCSYHSKNTTASPVSTSISRGSATSTSTITSPDSSASVSSTTTPVSKPNSNLAVSGNSNLVLSTEVVMLLSVVIVMELVF